LEGLGSAQKYTSPYKIQSFKEEPHSTAKIREREEREGRFRRGKKGEIEKKPGRGKKHRKQLIESSQTEQNHHHEERKIGYRGERGKRDYREGKTKK